MSEPIKPAKKRINSRQKGARGERLWRDVLTSYGYTARRGQQFAGGTDSPDVVCDDLAPIHFEVKCVQSLNICKVMREQAMRDAGKDKAPVIAHKRDGRPWVVSLPPELLFALLKNSDIANVIRDYKEFRDNPR